MYLIALKLRKIRRTRKPSVVKAKTGKTNFITKKCYLSTRKKLGARISLALACHSVFGVGFAGVLCHEILVTLIEHLTRRIMKAGIKNSVKKILGGALSESTLCEAPPRIALWQLENCSWSSQR